MKKTALVILGFSQAACQDKRAASNFFEPSGGGNPEAMQHFFWLIGQPGIWISLVFYISTFVVWGYCIHQAFIKKTRKKRHFIGFLFYLCFFPIWILWMMQRFHIFTSGGY